MQGSGGSWRRGGGSWALWEGRVRSGKPARRLGPPQCRAGGRPGLQAVESVSDQMEAQRRWACIARAPFGRLMGLESEAEWLRGQEGTKCRDAGQAKRGWEKMSRGREVGRPKEWFVLGARPASRGDKKQKSCVLTFWLHREARGFAV